MGHESDVQGESVDSGVWVEMVQLAECEIGVQSGCVHGLSGPVECTAESDGTLHKEALHGPGSPRRLPGPRGWQEAHNPAAPSVTRGG